MKKLFLSILTLVLFSSIGFAQEAKPTPSHSQTQFVFNTDPNIGPYTHAIPANGFAIRFPEPAQIPTRLFDVRSGNGLVLDGVTYPRATVIVYSGNAGKDAIIDALALMGGYQDTVPDPNNPGQTIPNPQSKQAFFNKRLEQFIRDNYKAAKISTAEKAAKATAEAAADAELPIQ